MSGIDTTSIEHADEIKYLDGDVWAVVKGKEKDTQDDEMAILFSRFCKLSDEADIYDQVEEVNIEMKGRCNLLKYYTSLPKL